MNGIIVLDKPKGITSFQACRTVSRYFGKEKTGHSGTLDPMATGVLPVFMGRATKLIPILENTDKAYIATVKMGEKTDSGDADGNITEKSSIRPSEAELREIMKGFEGESLQFPPMYSAVKVNGKKLYELAREGKTVERRSRPIRIYDIELLNFAEDVFEMKVSCSSGTYIRTLAEDITAKCGTLCHLTALRRITGCGFDISEAHTIEELDKTAENGTLDKLLVSPESLFAEKKILELRDKNLIRLFMNGFPFTASRAENGLKEDEMYRIYVNKEFKALANIQNGNLIKVWQSDILQAETDGSKK